MSLVLGDEERSPHDRLNCSTVGQLPAGYLSVPVLAGSADAGELGS